MNEDGKQAVRRLSLIKKEVNPYIVAEYEKVGNSMGYKSSHLDDNVSRESTKANLGWLFYKDYYSGLKDNKDFFESKNGRLIGFRCEREISGETFQLITEYPGLAIGTGNNHKTKSSDDEFKLGFSFDYSTGLPIIPGSSVKGLLRSAFPNSVKKKKDQHEEFVNLHYREPRRIYIREKLNMQDLDVDELEQEIFEGFRNGKSIRIYERDIFKDAILVKSQENVLGIDYITPHNKGKFKNPLPIKFMKVMPKVTFAFFFDLRDYKDKSGSTIVSVEQKRNLFRQILLDFGIGAKTNVGYGQFSEVDRI